MTADLYPKEFSMDRILKVPQRRVSIEIYLVERVNPTSEKPKFGRGVGQSELKLRSNDVNHR